MVYIPTTQLAQAGAAEVDPIEAMFGTPNTAFEFQTSSLVGLTALSPTPDVENSDTTVPDCYYAQDNATSIAWCGRYVAAPAAPFTAIAKVQDDNVRNDFNGSIIFIGEATPGVMEVMEHGGTERQFKAERFSSPTAFDSAFGTTENNIDPPLYLSIRVNTSTNVDYAGSCGGSVWLPIQLARNPAITIGSVGIAMKSENASGSASAFDFLRIWNSGLSLPGV